MAKYGALIFHLALAVSAFSTGRAAPQKTARSPVMISQEVTLVQVPVIVLDENGKIAAGLSKKDFRVSEDGIEQRLLQCEKERQPVSFALVADISESMTGKIPFVRDAAVSMVEPLSPQDKYPDEYSVFAVENHSRQLLHFTKDRPDLERRLPHLLMPTKGGTALYDGVYDAVLAANREAEHERRAVIVISDGGDNHSRHNLRSIKQLVKEAEVPVFSIMAGPELELPRAASKPPKIMGRNPLPVPVLFPSGNYIGEAERRGPSNLKALAEASGGGVFTAHGPESLSRIARTIGEAVRNQYVITYTPQNTDDVKRKNNWHAIHLELAPKEKFARYTVYYKSGYYRKTSD